MTTIVAPILTGTFAYLMTRRRDNADAGKASAEAKSAEADTSGKYRTLLNSEIEHRRKVETERDKYDDACKELSEENAQLRAENRILRDQVTAAGLPDLLRKPDTRPASRRGEQ